MNINDIKSFRLDDAVKFHDQLNPMVFNDTHLDPEVRSQLLLIAEDFMEHMGLDELKVTDIRLYGSNAAYTYTLHSDLDLHILVDMSKLSNDEVYKELFNSKKTVYNDSHDITVRGIDVELYIQDSKEIVKSLGEYSILNDKWVKYPSKRRANLDQHSSKQKYQKLSELVKLALASDDLDRIENVLATIKRYRKAGLEQGGEFSPENLAYKALRSNRAVDALYKHRDRLHSSTLSIDEQINECSGYIPSESERDDPRWERALSVDVHPDTMKKQAAVMGLGTIKRDGRPQQNRTDGKFRK
jgi:predicted nucleotidyltransferase